MRQQNGVQWLEGVPLSAGLAVGKAFIYRDILHLEHGYYPIQQDQVGDEHERLLAACAAVSLDLQEATHRAEQELDKDFSAIFRVQSEILKDKQLQDDLLHELERELVNAEQVVKSVFRRFENRLRSVKYALMAERGDDVADLARRILRELSGIRAHSLESLPRGTVIVAHRLLPSDTVYLPANSVAAAVVETGGPASHMAILARELGIPAISKIDGIVATLEPQTLLLIDGTKGRVGVAPNDDDRDAFLARMAVERSIHRQARLSCQEPAETIDGTRIKVYANIGARSDALIASENGAEGIGLYRLEKLFLARKSLPREDELEEELDATLRCIEGYEVTMRLLDVGGDKDLPSIDSPEEPNPALGRRGIRLLLDYEELLETQLRVLLRLSGRYRVRILAPMVTVAEDMAFLRSRVVELAKELECPIPPLGAMLETPAAALCTRELAEHCDFFSFGTNDLTQYTMAAGRENSYVVQYFDEKHPAVMRLLELALEGAPNKPFEVCGELAAHLGALDKLLKIGIRQLSTVPLAIPEVKEAIRQLDLSARN